MELKCIFGSSSDFIFINIVVFVVVVVDAEASKIQMNVFHIPPSKLTFCSLTLCTLLPIAISHC